MRGRGAARAMGLALLINCAPAAQAQQWDVQMPGVSHHFDRPRQRGAAWNERHEGFGLQRTKELDSARLHTGWVWRESAGVMVDSFGNPGAYAGASLAWRQRHARFDVDAGLAPMLLYRSTRFDDWRGPAPLKLIPALLPTLTVQHRPTGTGANIIAVPALDMGADFRMPGLVFMQLTRRLD